MKSKLFSSAVTGILALSTSASLAAGSATEGQKSPNKKPATVMGECHGVNSCQGQGACGGKGHSCAGKNSCKGKGWLKISKADCAEKKGKFKAEKVEEK